MYRRVGRALLLLSILVPVALAIPVIRSISPTATRDCIDEITMEYNFAVATADYDGYTGFTGSVPIDRFEAEIDVKKLASALFEMDGCTTMNVCDGDGTLNEKSYEEIRFALEDPTGSTGDLIPSTPSPCFTPISPPGPPNTALLILDELTPGPDVCDPGMSGTNFPTDHDGIPRRIKDAGTALAGIKSMGNGNWKFLAQDSLEKDPLCFGGATIRIFPALILSFQNQMDSSCNGADDGSFEIVVDWGGTAPYTVVDCDTAGYSVAGLTVQDLPPGTHTCEVNDVNGLRGFISVDTSEPAVLAHMSPAVTDATCPPTLGGPSYTGSVTLDVVGGTTPYRVDAISPSDPMFMISGLTISNLFAQSYTIDVLDANDCLAQTVVTIGGPSAFTFSVTSTTEVTCNGGADGTATVSIGGATGPVEIFDVQPSGMESMAMPGTIVGMQASSTVQLRDANLCLSDQFSVTIAEAPPISFTFSVIQTIQCNGASNGVVNLNLMGGRPPIMIDAVSGGATINGANIEGLSTGMYTLTLSHSSGACVEMVSETFFASQPMLLMVSLSPTDVSCLGASDGVIDVTGMGGTPPYSIISALRMGTPVGTIGGLQITDLSAGPVDVTIRDDNGCPDISDSTTIGAPPAVSGTLSDVSCPGAPIIEVTSPSGGNAPFNYNLEIDGDDLSPASLVATDSTAPPIAFSTSYNVVLLEGVCRGDLGSITPTDPGAFVFDTMITHETCNGDADGTLTLDITSGGTSPYTLVNDGGLPGTPGGSPPWSWSGISPSTYTIEIEDDRGCRTTTDVTINAASAVTASHTEASAVTCDSNADGVADFTMSGGSGGHTVTGFTGGSGSAAWDMMAGQITGLDSTATTVNFQDSNGCTATHVINLTDPPTPAMTIASGQILCDGDTADFTFSVSAPLGLPNYEIRNNNDGTINGLGIDGVGAGLLTFDMFYNVDVNECGPFPQSFTITDPNPLTATVDMMNSVLVDSCTMPGSGSIVLIYSGGLDPTSANPTSILDSMGGPHGSLMNLSPETYTITFQDSNGCTGSIVQAITAPLPPVLASVVNEGCNGANNGVAVLTITDNGGGTAFSPYTVTDPASLSGLAHGTPISTTFEDSRGCTTTTSFTLTEPSAVSVSVSGTPQVTCPGGSDATATAVPSGGGGSPVVGPTHTVTSLTPDGSFTGFSLQSMSPGAHTVSVEDQFGCSASVGFNVLDVTAFSHSASVTGASCGLNNGFGTISVSGGSGGYSIVGFNPTGSTNCAGIGGLGNGYPNVCGMPQGMITVSVQDSSGCPYDAVINVPNLGTIMTSLVSSTPLTCPGGSDGAATYDISGGNPPYTIVAGPTEDSATDLGGGVFRFVFSGLGLSTTWTIEDSSGCQDMFSLTLTEPTIDWTDTVTSMITCNGGSDGEATVTVERSSPAPTTFCGTDPVVSGGTFVSCTDSAGVATILINGIDAPSYSVTATDALGCSHSDSFTISEPAVVSATFAVTNPVSCDGFSDGEITLTGTGGLLPNSYTFSISPPGPMVSGNVISMMDVTTYTIDILDSRSCTGQIMVTLTDPAPIVFTIDHVSCAGDPQATLLISGLSGGGGGAPYTAVTNLGQTSSPGPSFPDLVITGVPYSVMPDVTVSDSAAPPCQAVQTSPRTTMINDITADITPTAPVCNGDSNGQYVVSNILEGQGGPYTYSQPTPHGVVSGTNPFTVTGLTPGSYTFDLTDQLGCITSGFTVNVPVQPPIGLNVGSVTTTQEITCPGATDGEVTFTIDNGSGDFTVTPSAPGVTVDDSATPFFTVGGISQANSNPGLDLSIVDDVTGCMASDSSISLSDPPPVTVVRSNRMEILCAGGNTGSIDLDVSGGITMPQDFAGSVVPGTATITKNSGTSFSVTGIMDGTTTATFSDINGCGTMEMLMFSDPLPLSGALSMQTTTFCPGTETGTVRITVTGGRTADPSVAYNSGPASSPAISPQGGGVHDVSGLGLGMHTFDLSDTNSCTGSVVVDMMDAAALSAAESSKMEISCNGGSDGSVLLTFSGGTSGDFQIDSITGPVALTDTQLSMNQFQLDGAADGSYDIDFSDMNGCTGSHTITWVEPTLVTVTVEDWSCAGDARLLVTGFGGSGLYFIREVRENGVVITPTITPATSPQVQYILSGLTFGASYVIRIEDQNAGCGVLDPGTIPVEPPQPTATLVSETQPSCFNVADGSITLSYSGGSGSGYTILSTDPIATIGQPDTVTNMVGGVDYDVEFEDDRNCPGVTFTHQLNNPAFFAVTEASRTDPTCPFSADGAVELVYSGGTAPYRIFSVSGGPFVEDSPTMLSGMQGHLAGMPPPLQYSIVTRDTNDCESMITVQLTSPAVGQVTVTDVSCSAPPNSRFEVGFVGDHGNPMFDFSIPPAGNVIFGPPTILENLSIGGPYEVHGVDDCGAMTPVMAVAAAPPSGPITAVVTPIVVPSCAETDDGQVELTFSGGSPNYELVSITPFFAQTWPMAPFVSTISISNTRSGSFLAQIRDAHGCIEDVSFVVDPPATPTATNVVEIRAALCSGTNDGEYEVTIGDSSLGPFTIVGSSPPGLVFSDTTLDGSNSYTTTITSVPEGDITLTILDNRGCENDVTFQSSALESFDLNVSLKTPVRCTGDANGFVTISVGNDLMGRDLYYTITPGVVTTLTLVTETPIPFNTVEGGITYTVHVEDDTGVCNAQVEILLDDPPPVSISPSLSSAVSCNGFKDGEVQVSAVGGALNYYQTPTISPNPDGLMFVSLNPGDPQRTMPEAGTGPWEIVGLGAGTYTITIYDELDCVDTAVITLLEPELLVVTPSMEDFWQMYFPTPIRWTWVPGQDGLPRTCRVDLVDDSLVVWRTFLPTIDSTSSEIMIVPHHLYSGMYRVMMEYAGCPAVFSQRFQLWGQIPLKDSSLPP